MLKSTAVAVAGVILSVDIKLVQEAFQFYVPKIKQAFNTLTIPGGLLDGITYDKIVLQNGTFDDVQISLVNGSGAMLNFTGLSFTMEKTNFHIKKHGISCHGDVWGSLSGTNISGEGSLMISGGAISPGTVTSDISLGRLSLDHQFPGDLCTFEEDIVNLFIGDINIMIEVELRTTINWVFHQLVNKSLKTFGTNVKFDHKVIFDYTTLNLSTTSKDATFAVLGQFKDLDKPNAPTNSTQNAIKMVSSAGRESTAWFSEFPFNTASEIYTNKGLLVDAVKIHRSTFNTTKVEGLTCDSNCTVWANFSVNSPPEFEFNQSQDHKVVVHFDNFNLSYTNISGSGGICLISNLIAHLKLTFNASNINGMDFIMVTMEFLHMWYDLKAWIGHVSPHDARPAIKLVVDQFGKLFNGLLHGIPLPVVLRNGTKISDVKTLYNENTVGVAANVRFPDRKSQYLYKHLD